MGCRASNLRTSNGGFTLIEMLVAVAVFTVLMIGLLNLLDTSTKVSKIESALADTQENVRYATYHLMRTARMMGGSIMPFARGGAGGNAWVAGEVHDNAAGNFSIFGATIDNMPGSDILVLRGFFDVAPFFIRTADVNLAATTVTIREHTDVGTSTERVINDLSPYVGVANLFLGRGLILSTPMGRTEVAPGLFIGGEYVTVEVTGTTGVTGTSPNRQIVLTYSGTAAWGALNWDGNPTPANQPDFWSVPRAGIVEAYAYYVDANMVLRRVAQRNAAVNPVGEPVAVNIGNLQVELGVDANGDSAIDPATEWDASPTLAEALAGTGAMAMRIAVLGRTPFEVPDWTEPALTFTSSGNMTVPTAGAAGPRHAKWRRMEVAVALRNFM
jgi:prepilin-type N-terminal cleavage/methylation domain-containing protein